MTNLPPSLVDGDAPRLEPGEAVGGGAGDGGARLVAGRGRGGKERDGGGALCGAALCVLLRPPPMVSNKK